MKCVLFDTGPIITLTMNNMLWLLEQLKSRFGGEFYVTGGVRVELIDRPFESKKYKFEALQIMKYVSKDVIKEVGSDEIKAKAEYLFKLANSCFIASGQPVAIVHFGEIETLAAAILLKAEAVVIDERTTRYIIDNPGRIQQRMENKLHTKIEVNTDALQRLKAEVKGLKVIRSIELVAIAFEQGLLDLYITEKEQKLMPGIKRDLLEAALWSMKLDGCAIAEEEIKDIVKYEMKQIS
jgi:predicted nucleic acid-binding protein